jgi:hypothetical protein
MGTAQVPLTVLPDKLVTLSGPPMANILDYKPLVNIPSFGPCRSLAYPPTASATAAAQGALTPMPCVPNTVTPWMPGKMDYLVKNQPALTKSSTCVCAWGGSISLVTDGQMPTPPPVIIKTPKKQLPK